MEHAHEPIVSLAKQILPIGQGRSVVDMGCGTGALLHRVATETGATPFGFDLDAAKVQAAHRLLAASGGDVRVGNMYASEWPFPEASFDLSLVPLGAFVDAPPALVSRLRRRVAQHAKSAIVYAYDDDLARFGTLSAMAEDAGIPLTGPTVDGIASRVQLDQLAVTSS